MGKKIRAQRIGKGNGRRSPSHRHKGDILHPKMESGTATILDIIHDPGRTAPVAIADYGNQKINMIAAEGMHVGQNISIGQNLPIKMGNTMPIGRIPEGTLIYNIEARPGDGGKFARGAGSWALVVSQGERSVVKMPSEQFKSLSPQCKATIGIAAGAGRTGKPFYKAGNKVKAYRSKGKKSYKVRGVAMNPVDHPHGGGGHQHVGKPSTVSVHAPPGRKVGRLSPKKSGKRRRK